MYRYLYKIILVFALGALAGCVPFPTKNIDTPKIEGTIYSGLGKLRGYSIFLSYDASDACSSREAVEVVTDLAGNFIFPPTYKWSPIRWAVPLDGFAVLNVCIESPEGLKKWAYISHLRTPSWAPDLKLSCDYDTLMSNPIEIDPQKIYEIEHGCQIVQS